MLIPTSSKIGQVHANTAKARMLCKTFVSVITALASGELTMFRIQPRSLDLLCFPEMAFTGMLDVSL